MSPPGFGEVVASRRSPRAFLREPMSEDAIRAVLEEAQHAPSNCNTQPWQMHIVSGAMRDALSDALLEAMCSGRYAMDFGFDKDAYPEPYRGRAEAQGRAYYQALGVGRDDRLERAEVVERNVRFFSAPHVALLFMPEVGDNVRVAADLGMYAQTFLLSLTARGYAGVPQAVLSYFADTARGLLGIGSDMKLLFGISFGMPDPDHPAFRHREGRVPLDDSVVWHA